MKRLGASELRKQVPSLSDLQKIKRERIYIVLEDVLDTYNVGAIFRLADAVSAKRLYLCGETQTPPNSKIKKASVNTWQWVDWDYRENALDAISEIRKNEPDALVIAVEQTKESLPYNKFSYRLPIALVVGNESAGILPDTLANCDGAVEIPMFGINKSLNVMVALGIVLYKVIETVKKP
jgi:tRNA G18 (ribose-2'-O)-methylase SpoU